MESRAETDARVWAFGDFFVFQRLVARARKRPTNKTPMPSSLITSAISHRYGNNLIKSNLTL